MSSGDELYVRSIFSSDEVRKEVEEYLQGHFKQMLRTTLIRHPISIDKLNIPFAEENLMLKSFVAEYTQALLNEAVKAAVLQTYVRDKMYEFVQAAVDREISRNLQAFEKAFKRNKTIPKGVKK